MNTTLRELNHCSDVNELKDALHKVCAPFGPFARLDILSASRAGQPQALCFFRLTQPQQETALMQAYGIGRFGGDLVVVADLVPAPGHAATRLFDRSEATAC
ncbi:MAG: RNA-binding protein [Polaromonas sp.]|nr:RNA-binding protein [Polaromonas sp.]